MRYSYASRPKFHICEPGAVRTLAVLQRHAGVSVVNAAYMENNKSETG